jgi:hypothetical protein
MAGFATWQVRPENRAAGRRLAIIRTLQKKLAMGCIMNSTPAMAFFTLPAMDKASYSNRRSPGDLTTDEIN